VLNGVNGRLFTDKTTGKSLFLPAAGYRHSSGGTLIDARTRGSYWGSTPASGYNSYVMRVTSNYADDGSNTRTFGFSVRCVQ
jgi:hypothetical protein